MCCSPEAVNADNSLLQFDGGLLHRPSTHMQAAKVQKKKKTKRKGVKDSNIGFVVSAEVSHQAVGLFDFIACLLPSKHLEWTLARADFAINGSLSCGSKSWRLIVLAMQEMWCSSQNGAYSGDIENINA